MNPDKAQPTEVYISQPDFAKNKNWWPKLKKIILLAVLLLVILVILGIVLGNLNNIQNFIKVNITDRLADYQTGSTEFSEADSLSSNASGKLSLKGPAEASVDSQFQTEIMISSDSKVRAVDAVILYDPKMLKDPSIKTGTIFDTYPFHTIDQNKGRLLISGIITGKGAGFEGEGSFASITFTPIKKGKTYVKLQFAKDQTTDSNVLQAQDGRDILIEVTDLEIVVK